jgi:hypothetical protein
MPLLSDLEKIFYKTHITISEIDSKELYKYYFEKVLTIKSENNKTILEILYRDKKISEETFIILSNVRLSLFKVKKVKKETFIVIDLFDPKIKIELPLTYYWKAIAKNEIIQSFLYGTPPQLSTNGITHSKGLKKFIQNKVSELLILEDIKEEKELLLQRLFRNFVIFKRYKHKTALEIYELEL